MAEVMTYTSLFSDIQSYLERGETTDPDVYAQIPRFIMLAENRLAVELKVLGTLRYVTTTLTPSTATLIKPERWRETVSISLTTSSGKQYLFPRSYEFVRAFWPDATVTGTPRYYADYDYDHFLFAPTPALGSTIELCYYELIQPLDGTNQTNWFTDYAPQALLYASLYEVMVYLKDDDRIAAYQNYLDRALQGLTGENERRKTDRTQDLKT